MSAASLRKLLTIAAPAGIGALLALMILTEVWVRATWDPHKGVPGFFLTDASRGQRLAAGYDGWFAGVPVHINSLELRDPREYTLAKRPNTFRLLVLGDSVTFGHGSVYEHTYPYLTEQRLKAWKPGIDWQVWNAAVPGYDTSQELAQLLEVGDRFQPDLVVVGFFDNDIVGNQTVVGPGRARRATASVLSYARLHMYSFELYKKIYLTLAWRLSASDDYRHRLEHIATEESILNVADASALGQQRLTLFERLSDEQVKGMTCTYGMKPNPDLIPAMQRDPGYERWMAAVRGLQHLNHEGRYHVAFFINDVPPICPDGDMFYDGGSKAIDELFLEVLGNGAPAVSCYDAFLHVRPSQMPNATAHSIGNANVVKADVLFEFLRDRVLPSLLSTSAGDPPRS